MQEVPFGSSRSEHKFPARFPASTREELGAPTEPLRYGLLPVLRKDSISQLSVI